MREGARGSQRGKRTGNTEVNDKTVCLLRVVKKIDFCWLQSVLKKQDGTGAGAGAGVGAGVGQGAGGLLGGGEDEVCRNGEIEGGNGSNILAPLLRHFAFFFFFFPLCLAFFRILRNLFLFFCFLSFGYFCDLGGK